MMALAMTITVAPQPTYAAGGKSLISLEYTESSNSLESRNYEGLYNGITTPDEQFYAQKDILYLDASEDAYIVYDLGGKYSELSGKAVTEKGRGSGNYTITFYGDGKKLKTIKDITHENQGIDFKVDVEGVKELKIVSSNSGRYGYGWVYLAKPTLKSGDLTLSDTTLTMNTKDSTFVTYSYTDAKGKEKTTGAKWKSSNAKIAKVSSKGKKSKNEVQLTWTAQKGVSSYQVYMYDTDLEEYTLVATAKGSINSARIKDLSKNTSYKFKVRAVLKSGKSYYGEFSKVITVKTTK